MTGLEIVPVLAALIPQIGKLIEEGIDLVKAVVRNPVGANIVKQALDLAERVTKLGEKAAEVMPENPSLTGWVAEARKIYGKIKDNAAPAAAFIDAAVKSLTKIGINLNRAVTDGLEKIGFDAIAKDVEADAQGAPTLGEKLNSAGRVAGAFLLVGLLTLGTVACARKPASGGFDDRTLTREVVDEQAGKFAVVYPKGVTLWDIRDHQENGHLVLVANIPPEDDDSTTTTKQGR